MPVIAKGGTSGSPGEDFTPEVPEGSGERTGRRKKPRAPAPETSEPLGAAPAREVPKHE